MNFKIRVEGVAKANVPVKNIDVGAIYGEDADFIEYMDEGSLKDKLDKDAGAYMEFEKKGRSLVAVVEYNASEKLTDDELAQLVDYTQGQWSDGIGEGFEQNPCAEVDGKDLYISPWFHGQEPVVTQVEVD